MKLEQAKSQARMTTFSKCIRNPASIAADDTSDLTLLSNQFPYCQILHAFISRSTLNQGEAFDKSLTKAAVYSSDRNMLYITINRPETLLVAPRETNLDATNKVDDSILEKPSQAEDFITDANFLMIEDPAETTSVTTATTDPDMVVEAMIEPETPEEFDKLTNNTFKPVEELSLNSQASVSTPTPNNPVVDTKATYTYDNIDSHEISKYDDDKMPFSFLWWLSKTRKEHSETYQPYLSPQLKAKQTIKNETTEGLNHQIVEQIFYQQTPIAAFKDEGDNTFTFKHKEEAILDTFIRTEPQIKPPKAENLSTENKARESSQDSNDLVSETLAKIYTRQMLLDKAIDTYKKLSLKFPQKSAYFTELIRSLEKKINK